MKKETKQNLPNCIDAIKVKFDNIELHRISFIEYTYLQGISLLL